MSAEQLTAVKDLLDRCFGDSTWSLDILRSQLEKTDSRCTVVIVDEIVVGFLAFEQVLDEGSIIEVAVHPEYRRRGIARRMIQSAVENAENLSSVFLEVRERNTAAIALYEALGFTKVGVRKNYYDAPKENGVIMKWEINL